MEVNCSWLANIFHKLVRQGEITLSWILNWIAENKEWLFSGLGITIILWLFRKIKGGKESVPTMTVEIRNNPYPGGLVEQCQSRPDGMDGNYSLLPISENNLTIYRTNERPEVNWDRVESLKYDKVKDGYFLSGYTKGCLFKHFVLCHKKDKVKIEEILKKYNFIHVSGDDEDTTSGKCRVWFLDLRFKTEPLNKYDPKCNNIEGQRLVE